MTSWIVSHGIVYRAPRPRTRCRVYQRSAPPVGAATSAAPFDGDVSVTVAPVLIAVALPAVIAGMDGGKYSVEVSESPRARLAAGAAA
jgi:hypothetical protein